MTAALLHWASIERRLPFLALAAALACGRGNDVRGVVVPVLSPELAIGARFVAEREYRRAAFEQSLALNDNAYARERLDHYALDGEWDALTLHNPKVSPLTLHGEAPFVAVWSGTVDWTEAPLLELGQRAFEEFPAQRHPLVSAAIDAIGTGASAPARLESLGLWHDDRDRVGGLVRVEEADATIETSLTCASCHARVDGAGHLLHGAASKLRYEAVLGVGAGTERESRPGVTDVTSDRLVNPVAFADLRATRHQRFLHHTGNLENGLAALAVRIETLLIMNSSQTLRPPREVVFALALYIWRLGEERERAPSSVPGAAVFSAACAGCHSGPSGEGDRVTAARVGTDPAASQSSARGGDGYRVPSLYRVSERTHLTHEAWPLDIEGFMDPERRATRAGHRFGLELPAAERSELVAYLNTL